MCPSAVRLCIEPSAASSWATWRPPSTKKDSGGRGARQQLRSHRGHLSGSRERRRNPGHYALLRPDCGQEPNASYSASSRRAGSTWWKSKLACCVDSASIGPSTSAKLWSPWSSRGSNSATPPALGSNGCSPPSERAKSSPGPAPRSAKSRNHCAEVPVDLSGLEFGNALLSALGTPRNAIAECMITAFALERGVMQTRALILDTQEAILTDTGRS
jgi:hypothetical protein